MWYKQAPVELTDLLVLLEELVGELGENLEEGEVGRRSGRIQRVLEGGGRHQDPLSVQAGHRLPVLQRVQPEGERKPLGQLLQTIKMLYLRTWYAYIKSWVLDLGK